MARVDEAKSLGKGLKGRIASATRTDDVVTVTVTVVEDDGTEAEYEGSVSVDALARLRPEDQRRAVAEAVRVERDRQRAREGVDLSALTGELELTPVARPVPDDVP